MAKPSPSRAASASSGKPPEGVEPARLFRLLARSPRPLWPLALALPGVPRLYAQGLTGAEVDEAHDGAADVDAGSRRMDAVGLRLAAATVVDARGAPAFGSFADLAALPGPVADAIVGAALDGLSVVSPTYARSDFIAWRDALLRGARDVTNRGTAGIMASAHDVVILPSRAFFHERPDRYFGLPLCALTDGQLMAFRAARMDLE